MDYYDVLGVSKAASADEISAAYREKSKRHHPDVNDDRFASQRFKHLQAAKETLTDRKERARYDRLGHDEYVTKFGGYARAELEPFYADDSEASANSSAAAVEEDHRQVAVQRDVEREHRPRREREREQRREDGQHANTRDRSSTDAGTGDDPETAAQDGEADLSLRDRYETHVTRAGYLVFASVGSFVVLMLIIVINETDVLGGSIESLPTLLGYVGLIAIPVSLVLAGVSILYLTGLTGVRIYLAVTE